MITTARPFSGEAASHYYWPDGRPCYEVPCKSRPGEMRKTTVADCRKLGLTPSVTTITKVLDRPLITDYKVEQAILAVLSAPEYPDETIDAFVERIIHTEKHQDEERDIAAERGREIHKALQLAMTSDVLLHSEYIKEPAEFLRKTGRTVATEKVVVGTGYAGMLDLLLENDSEFWVIDFKTGKKIPKSQYNENKLQLSAYCGALGNTGDKRLRCANLYISTKEIGQWKIIESEEWPKDFQRFELLVKYHKLTNNL